MTANTAVEPVARVTHTVGTQAGRPDAEWRHPGFRRLAVPRTLISEAVVVR